MSIAVQLQTIASMSLCGCLMGIGFDTYQYFREKGRFPKWLTFVFDLLFWFASIAVVFYVLVEVNQGIVRFPIFFGILIGAWVYFVLGSKTYIQFLITVIKFAQWLYKTILTIIQALVIRPIMFLYRIIFMILAFILSILMTIGRFIWKIILWISSPFTKWGQSLGKSFHRQGKGIWHRIKNWITSRRKKQE
ncbi:spore cortex biosynthesis protein YabQ [Brevibacillus ginsengisoli]|uniref:spore cortex biosynthesis protein YabQ n=1 Tax=Brevibacillus ginsengisoli TaxID=363854 RepID=UPI003CF94B55